MLPQLCKLSSQWITGIRILAVSTKYIILSGPIQIFRGHDNCLIPESLLQKIPKTLILKLIYRLFFFQTLPNTLYHPLIVIPITSINCRGPILYDPIVAVFCLPLLSGIYTIFTITRKKIVGIVLTSSLHDRHRWHKQLRIFIN